MKFKSQVYTQTSGSIGGITYSHNQGGLYTRARTIPVDPASSFQLAVRNSVAQLVSRWRQVLTQLQRDAWDVFAVNTPVVNSFGDSVLISGQAWYIKANSARNAVGTTIVNDAPTIFGNASLTTPTVVASAATETYAVTFTNTDIWATAVGGHLLMYGSRPQNVSINFFKGPYRFAGRVNGAVVPPTSPAAIVSAFPFPVGVKLFVVFVATQANGQISAKQRIAVVPGA